MMGFRTKQLTIGVSAVVACALLAFALCMLLLGRASAEAGWEVECSTSDTELYIDDTLTVDIVATGEDIAALSATLDYDHDALELEQISCGGGLAGQDLSFMETTSADLFSFFANEADCSEGTVVATATFLCKQATDDTAVRLTDLVACTTSGVKTFVSTTAALDVPIATEPCIVALDGTLMLNGAFGMVVPFAIPDRIMSVDGAYLQVTSTDGDVVCETLLTSSAKTGGVYNGIPTYTFPFYVGAYCLNDDYVLRFFAGDGTPLRLRGADGTDCTETGCSGSAASHYASTVAATSTADPMLSAMLYCGSACQTYFNHNASSLAAGWLEPAVLKSLQEEAAALTADDMKPYRPSSTDTEAVKCVGANLAFGSTVAVCGYFEIDEGSADDYAFTVDGAAATATVVTDFGWADADSSKTYVMVFKSGILADKLDLTHSFKVTKASDGTVASTLEYGPMGYVWVALNKADKYQKIGEVCRSLYVYNKYAKQYALNSALAAC